MDPIPSSILYEPPLPEVNEFKAAFTFRMPNCLQSFKLP
jgi:hypothetical protein